MTGRWMILAGIILLVAGLIVHFAPGLLSWFGRLPGDIRFESGRTRVFIPVTSMLVVSVVISVIISLFRR
ncbi:DUF2905 domain-containing protein [Oleidesulfovibrio sp.]|uniref:DUF2905 domain-containing protein n=1 Tax=Oleidesulfovibrio sp. TaxID=2909707 RepID=UPI003A8A400B